MADRYKEGYNQANRYWQKKIQKEIEKLRKHWDEYTSLGNPLILKVQIDLLEYLLKKG